jgi:hypothetical protein
MEILRVPPYILQVNIEVSLPGVEYEYHVRDMADLSVFSGTVQSNSESMVSIDLPKDYDNTYVVAIDNDEHEFDVVRPYVDPSLKGNTASEIAEYAKNERLARAIIDSVTLDGFYYKKKVIDAMGNGSDYLPIWDNVRKVLTVLENNTLVYDSSDLASSRTIYEVNKDKTAIIELYYDAINRYQGAPQIFRGGHTDYLDLQYAYRGFPNGFDYQVTVAAGYKKIPQDIVLATEMLIEDISCGKLDYYRRYISDYNTDQFKIKFDSAVFSGTGNIVVDKILARFTPSIRTIGAL